jgi:hypothetical protein
VPPPGEVASWARPMGLMVACEWAVPVAFEHLVALVTGGGGPMDAHCISEVRGAGGAQQLGQALPTTVWVLLASLGVVWMPQGCRMLGRGIRKAGAITKVVGGGGVLLLPGGPPSSLCLFAPYPSDGPLTPSSSLSEPLVVAIVCWR